MRYTISIRRRFQISATVLAFALAAIVVAPFGDHAEAAKVLRLGVLGPLTGDLAFGGQFQLKGGPAEGRRTEQDAEQGQDRDHRRG